MLITRSVISGTAREIGIRGSREGVTAVESHWTERRARRRKHAKSHGFGRGLSRGRASETRVMPVSCLRRVRKKEGTVFDSRRASFIAATFCDAHFWGERGGCASWQ